MRHFVRRGLIHLGTIGSWLDLVKMVIPDDVDESSIVDASRDLFAAYSLFQIDSMNYLGLVACILHRIQAQDNVPHDIKKLLKNTLKMVFLLPESIKKGYFYLWYDEKKEAIAYALMKGSKCYQGEITDPVYDHFAYKLRHNGFLPLREVNFLIDKVVKTRRQLKENAMVIDPVCQQAFSQFLKQDVSIQYKAAQLLRERLKLFEYFTLSEQGYSGFFDAPCALKKMDENIFVHTHMKKYHESEALMSKDRLFFKNIEDHERLRENMDETVDEYSQLGDKT